MLAEFQQALADLVASPRLCREARADPALLACRYALTERERRRLAAMLDQPGMALNCMLYRANRLAPLALNLGDLCRALGPALGPLLTDYTERHPHTNVHFYVECERFCAFVAAQAQAGLALSEAALAALARERAAVRMHIEATRRVL